MNGFQTIKEAVPLAEYAGELAELTAVFGMIDPLPTGSFAGKRKIYRAGEGL